MEGKWRRGASIGPAEGKDSCAGVRSPMRVPEPRVSVGPRGTYVFAGPGGFRYFQRFNRQPDGPQRKPFNPSPPPDTRDHGTEVQDSTCLVESTADELLEEIRRKGHAAGYAPVAVGVCVTGLVLCLGLLIGRANALETTGCLTVGLAALVSLPWVIWFDRRAPG